MTVWLEARRRILGNTAHEPAGSRRGKREPQRDPFRRRDEGAITITVTQ